jgi:hypothetical protein
LKPVIGQVFKIKHVFKYKTLCASQGGLACIKEIELGFENKSFESRKIIFDKIII